jgi:beta-lactamase regulating signal transducer with metallopeptidase domain
MMSYCWKIITSYGGFEFLTLLALATAKATLLLAFAALICFACRRFSAAARHLVWASALCASLLLPFLSFIKMWEVPILPAQMLVLESPGAKGSPAEVEAYELSQARVPDDLSPAPGASAEGQRVSALPAATDSAGELTTAPNAPALPLAQPRAASLVPQLLNFVPAAWLVGMLLVLFKLLAGFIATGFLTRRAVEVEEPALVGLFSSLLIEVNLKSKVRLLRSEHTSMPMVYGILRPAVLLPAEADAWSEERRRMVLLHELTHITRRDCLTQMLAQMACAFYWFNPLIWRAARWLRVEREQACDDYVLSIGTKPSDYANHLLDIARSTQERSIFDWSQTTSVAMARRSQLEGRLLAILSKDNKRGAVSRAVLTGLVALTCLLLFSLAAVHPTVIHAQNPRSSDVVPSVEHDETDMPMPGSFMAGGSPRGDDAADDGTREGGGKPETVVTAVDNVPEPISNREHTGQEVASVSREEAERSAEQEVAGVAVQTRPIVQLPEAQRAINQEAPSFINVGQTQERSVQAQDRPLDFMDGMASVGYPNLSVDELIRLKTARVTPDYVRGLRALGFTNLTVKELVSMSIHGVTAAYIQALRGAGYNALSAKEVTSFRIHGITPEYIRTLRDAGHGNLTAKQLREFKIHGVTPAFISGVSAAGYSNLSSKELVSLRIYNVTPEFIRKARSRLGDLTIRQLISLKSMNILEEDKGKDKPKS